MKVVPLAEIPQAVDVPLDDLLAVYKVAREMEFVCEQEQGIGLSAVQVGVPWKMFVAKSSGQYEHWLNATYSPVGDDATDSIEGCLSLKTSGGEFRRFKVKRFKRIVVHGRRLSFLPVLAAEELSLELTGLNAVVFQHEIDHHHGILISDIGQELEIY